MRHYRAACKRHIGVRAALEAVAYAARARTHVGVGLARAAAELARRQGVRPVGSVDDLARIDFAEYEGLRLFDVS